MGDVAGEADDDEKVHAAGDAHVQHVQNARQWTERGVNDQRPTTNDSTVSGQILAANECSPMYASRFKNATSSQAL